MVYRLDDELWFPNPRGGEPDGLIAVGGDLSVNRLLFAYSYGIFPWYSFRDYEEILWWCPMQRFVIFPDEVHISHSMRTMMNKDKYRVSINEDFAGVINECSKLRYDTKGAWLGEDMIKAYTNLHDIGRAYSVEVWEKTGEQNADSKPAERLVGGLYGVDMGKCFCGESMFSLIPSASKMALIHLAKHLSDTGVQLIDCQFETAHLKSMGGRFISWDEYLKYIWGDNMPDIPTID